MNDALPFVALILFGIASHEIATGRVRIKSGHDDRYEQPGDFWASVGMTLLFAVALVATFRVWLGKRPK